MFFLIHRMFGEDARLGKRVQAVAAGRGPQRGHPDGAAQGARADRLVVDGDPLDALAGRRDPDRHLEAVVKDGELHRDDPA